MAQPFNIEATQVGKIFNGLGTFWSNIFAQPRRARALVALTRQNQVIGDFEAMVGNLAGRKDIGERATFVTVYFKAADIFATGQQMYGDPQTDFRYANPPETVYGSYRVRYFGLPLPDVLPTVIQAYGKKLFVGVDFFIQNEYLLFREDPRFLFPFSQYVIVSGRRREYRSVLSYVLCGETGDYNDIVVDYYRKFQTPQYFYLALCAIGGLQILRKSQKLIDVTKAGRITNYVFENETLRVSYPHEPLTVGTVYPDLYVIGDGIQIFQADGTDASWWRQVDWQGGFSLDPILNFSDLVVRDADTIAYVAGQDDGSTNGSKVHVRLDLTGDFYREDAYWKYVASRETRTGQYLNATVGLQEEQDGGDPSVADTFAKLVAFVEEANVLNARLGLPKEEPQIGALPRTKIVNALDVFFQAVLKDTAYVVLFTPGRIPRIKEVYAFLSRDTPIGGVPIIITRGNDVPGERVKFGDTIRVTESVVLAASGSVSVAETVSLNALVKQSLVLTPESPLI